MEPLDLRGAAFPPSLGNSLEVQPGGSHDLSQHFGDGLQQAQAIPVGLGSQL